MGLIQSAIIGLSSLSLREGSTVQVAEGERGPQEWCGWVKDLQGWSLVAQYMPNLLNLPPHTPLP